MDNTQTNTPITEPTTLPTADAGEVACAVRLSARDAAQVLATAENPPAPNEAALAAARRLLQRHE